MRTSKRLPRHQQHRRFWRRTRVARIATSRSRRTRVLAGVFRDGRHLEANYTPRG